MNKLKRGDEVFVASGKDKGRRGVIVEILDKQKVLVEGINIVKKHTKPNPNAGVEGGIIDKAMPIDASNVAVLSPSDGKPTRVGYRFNESGEKVRICKRTGVDLDG